MTGLLLVGVLVLCAIWLGAGAKSPVLKRILVTVSVLAIVVILGSLASLIGVFR